MTSLCAWPAAARAQVFMTQAQALDQAFHGARIERRSIVLTEAQHAAIEARAHVEVESRLNAAYLAWRGDTLDGTAFFDSRIVRTMPAVLMVTIAPDSTVRRVDVLAFHEPSDYRPTPHWLDQFAHEKLTDRLWPERDIRRLSGATLTTRSVTESTRLALALYDVIVAPTLEPVAGVVRSSAAPRAPVATSPR
jgi:Na+-translocating ferredoxin:NAD+ oxidoreductase subunit G